MKPLVYIHIGLVCLAWFIGCANPVDSTTASDKLVQNISLDKSAFKLNSGGGSWSPNYDTILDTNGNIKDSWESDGNNRFMITVTITPTDATNPTIDWTISDTTAILHYSQTGDTTNQFRFLARCGYTGNPLRNTVVLTATSSNGKTATCTVDLYDLHGIAMQARTDLGLGDSTARTVTHSATGTTGPVVCAYMFPDMVVNPAFLRSDGYTSNYDLTFTDYSGANGWVYNGSTSNIYWSGLQQGLSYCTGKVAVTNSPLAIVIPTLYEYTPVRRGGTIFFFDDIIGDDANTTVYTNNGGSAWELSSTGWSCVTHKYWQ